MQTTDNTLHATDENTLIDTINSGENKELLINFATAIATLVGISLIVQIVINFFTR